MLKNLGIIYTVYTAYGYKELKTVKTFKTDYFINYFYYYFTKSHTGSLFSISVSKYVFNFL